MAINYQFVKHRDMRLNAPEGQMVYYAQTFTSGRTSFNELAEFVAGHCSMSRGDVMNVFDAIIFFLKMLLLKGDVVELGELGNFRLTAGASGVMDPKEFNTRMFNRPKITFIPGTMLTSIYRDVKYERTLPGDPATPPAEGGEEGGGDDVLS